MAITRNVEAPSAAVPQARTETEVKKFKPVTVFAAVGVFALVMEIWVLGHWITGPNFKTTPVGPSPVPTYMKIGLTSLTAFGIVAWFFCMWHFLIKPWRREGHITLDGMFSICFILIYWMDPLGDMIVPQFTYNAWLTNWGSWLADVPGTLMPGANLIPEPIFLTGPLYLWCIFGVCVVANNLMRKAKARWPHMTNFQLIMGTIGVFIVWDLFWELTFIRIGYWTYPTTPRFLTLFGGDWYRIHLTEPVAWGTTWAAFTLLRYFKDDKGRTLVERGVDDVRTGTKGKQLLSFFALYGGISLLFLFGYVIPTNAIAIHGDGWPKDTLRRSYFTNGLCGAGTDYACPSQGAPIPRPKSAHLNPQSELVPGQTPPNPEPPIPFTVTKH
jgi:hypothetical protein